MGTGLRPCGQTLAADGAFHGTVLLSHLHWDHIQGLPFFGPISEPDAVLDVYGPAQEAGPLDAVFRGVMQQPYFPITPDELHGTVRFHGAGDEDFAINGAKVRSRWVRHTSPTIGFRVDLEGHSVAYVSDHGPGCSRRPRRVRTARHPRPRGRRRRADPRRCSTRARSSRASVTSVTSTVDYAVHVAREAGARRLALFHHCPSHSDDIVDLMHLYASALAERVAGNLEVLAARRRPGRRAATRARPVSVSIPLSASVQ